MKSEIANNVRKLNFLSIFLEARNPGNFYASISNRLNGKRVFTEEKKQPSAIAGSVFEVRDFPGYLSAEVKQKDNGWKMLSVNTFKGSCINLNNYDSARDYHQKTFSAKRRSKMRTYQRRLEQAFDIRYQCYYGHIPEKDYNSLFEILKGFIVNRFAEKNTLHDDLHLWEHYHNIAYPLILDKQAVLFVIFHADKPISIALNLVQGNLMYSYIRGFNTDYSKFYLGFVDFSGQIKWAFDQGFEVFDLLKGAYEYKDRLKDHEYYFQNQIFYDATKLIAGWTAKWKFYKWRTFYALFDSAKKLGFHHFYRRISGLSLRRKADPHSSQRKYIVEEVEVLPPSDELKQVNINADGYDFLRRPAYDFLYTTQDSLVDLKVYKLKQNPDAYLFMGSKLNRLIAFVPTKFAR